ncbi:RNA polymerase sigma factor [Fervidibacillus halotolerans]|uniref:Sigma-70 family RNA polymerase sigma factor n=1 Tax=Fervidibacillus halotolerans TaxID=2980027 RepID=A0A9E8LXB7_9BACI|nr:sigma-70 family RNA polymerase sigma factor [Fervidibacillus halotolerans]WAA11458.1 sigma-70 family RNA polymerase sigma factor [Fervidibacillus halotolerans]
MEDGDIIQLYWERKERAISETDKKYGRYCYRIAYNILQNNEDSEECVSDTYLKTWSCIPDDYPKMFSAYLGKITRNIAINRYRRLRAKKRGGGEIEQIFHELEGCIPSKQSVEKEWETNQLIEHVNRFLASLKVEQRIVFVKRYWYAQPIHSIANELSISESKVKSILFRCRKKLKHFLEEEGINL